MDEITRLEYLAAMGIDVWLPRTQAALADVPFMVSKSELLTEPLTQETQSVASSDLSPPHPKLIPEKETVAPSTLRTHHDVDAWEVLQQEVKACQACALCQTRTQTVFGVGNRKADWLLIGEAPGQSEDQQGEPFVGVAGQLLNEMLLAIGLPREEVFIANMLKCRPPNNRDPHADEIQACHGFLQRQIALIQPKVILAVGRIAAQNLLNKTESLSKLRGKQYQLLGVPLYIVHHPAYLLRSPLEKRKAWEDLQFALAGYRRILFTN